MHAAPHIIVRFALRGLGASAAVRAERANFTRNGVSDVVLLDAAANASRARGPLASLFCWYRCATTAWPRARLVGKADDDVWLHLPGISAHLHASPSPCATSSAFAWRVTITVACEKKASQKAASVFSGSL